MFGLLHYPTCNHDEFNRNNVEPKILLLSLLFLKLTKECLHLTPG